MFRKTNLVAYFGLLFTPAFAGSEIRLDNHPGSEEADGMILYVDGGATGVGDGKDWCNAYVFLQDALALAQPGMTIRVADGVYAPDMGDVQTPGDRTASFALKSGVRLEGGYAGCGSNWPNHRRIDAFKTVLSGDLAGNDGPGFVGNEENSIHVVTGYGVDRAVLDGFTVTGGYADGETPENEGAGVTFRDSTEVRVSDCTFVANQATRKGGGLAMFRTSGIVEHSLFVGNQAVLQEGGGLWGFCVDVSVSHCDFRRNGAVVGGGLAWIACSGIESFLNMYDCSFHSNSAEQVGGGALIVGEEVEPGGSIGEAHLDRLRFKGNVARAAGGAVFLRGAQVTFDQVEFSRNRTTNGQGDSIWVDP